MKSSSLSFPYAARRVYTACMAALRGSGAFRSIHGEERTFHLTASKGLPVFGENLTVNVIATGTDSCEVTMKSSDKLLFNPLNWGNNVRNVNDLDQYIRNEVYRLCDASQLGLRKPEIKLTQPEIRLRPNT